MQRVIKPEKVPVSSTDGEFGLLVGFGGGLGVDLVDDVTADWIAHFVRVSYCDIEARSRGLLYADAWLRLSSWSLNASKGRLGRPCIFCP